MASVSDRLKKAAVTTVKTKNEHPVLSGVGELVDKVVELKKKVADMEQLYEQTEMQLTERTFAMYDELRDSNYTSSIKCEGKSTNGVQVIYSDKYSALPIEMEADLRKQDPKYDEHFVEVRDLKVKKDMGKTISDEVIDKLTAALGDDFEKIFEVKVAIGAKKGLAERLHEVPEKVRGYLKQASPSVRNLTEDGKVC